LHGASHLTAGDLQALTLTFRHENFATSSQPYY